MPEMEGKTVGVYFSKKNFEFSDQWLKPLMQFIKAGEGQNVTIEDLKLQAIILIGNSFSDQLDTVVGADSVYFLNENPELAMEFMRGYGLGTRNSNPLGSSFQETDYIMVVNPIKLETYPTNSVYVRSNQIITEKIDVRRARLSIDLFEVPSGKKVATTNSCTDERDTKVPVLKFDLESDNSVSGKFLSKSFTHAIFELAEGTSSNCAIDPKK